MNLDAAEKDANKRFDEWKAKGIAIEQNMAKEQEALNEIRSEIVRLQGEHRAIQNLRKQAEGSTLPTKKK